MKLLVDMNLSPNWVDRLARHGFEAVHWSTIGAPTARDDEILAWGRKHQFVVIHERPRHLSHSGGHVRPCTKRRANPNA